MTSTLPSPTRLAPASLRERSHLPFAIGAVALVTLGAFENRAVSSLLGAIPDTIPEELVAHRTCVAVPDDVLIPQRARA